MQKYKLGDPTDPEYNLGPVCSVASAERIRKQVADAGRYFHDKCIPECSSLLGNLVAAGAKALIPEELFPAAQPYVA